MGRLVSIPGGKKDDDSGYQLVCGDPDCGGRYLLIHCCDERSEHIVFCSACLGVVAILRGMVETNDAA